MIKYNTQFTIFQKPGYLLILTIFIWLLSLNYHLGFIGIIIFIRFLIILKHSLKVFKYNKVLLFKKELLIKRKYPNKEIILLNLNDIKKVKKTKTFLSRSKIELQMKNNSRYIIEDIDFNLKTDS